MNPSDEENQGQGPGPVIRDRRRIDPQTGQVRDIPGQAKPGKHSASEQSGQHPAPPQSAAPGARAPGGGMPGGGAAGGGAGAPAGPGSPDAAGRADEADAALTIALAERTADLQRLQAEYANYRKRVERDRVAVREQALANVLSELLPVLDDIGRAREHGELTGGFKSVAESLEASAAKLGLTTYGEVGDPFDPTLHEALMHSYSAKVTEPTCVQILQPGYKVGDRIVRPARVAVAEPGDDGQSPHAGDDAEEAAE